MKCKRYITLLVVVSCFIFSGCSNGKLTHKKAAQLIENFYEYPNVETVSLNLNVTVANHYTTLIRDGYLSVPQYYGLMFPDLTVTDKGMPYRYAGTEGALFATNMRKLKEVTSILFDDGNETRATVEFTCVRHNITPFGHHKNYKEHDEVTYSVKMAKYDDGWRITTPNGKNYKEADFPDVEEFLEN